MRQKSEIAVKSAGKHVSKITTGLLVQMRKRENYVCDTTNRWTKFHNNMLEHCRNDKTAKHIIITMAASFWQHCQLLSLSSLCVSLSLCPAVIENFTKIKDLVFIFMQILVFSFAPSTQFSSPQSFGRGKQRFIKTGQSLLIDWIIILLLFLFFWKLFFALILSYPKTCSYPFNWCVSAGLGSKLYTHS